MMSYFRRFIVLLALTCGLAGVSASALANSDKGSASASGAPTAHLEPFVVNLSSFDKYLQAVITLQVTASEIGDKIKTYMPMVRHVVIMTLSSKDSSEVQSSAGKKALVEELKEKLNSALKTSEHEGVSDVFFENFVIQ
ncbi:flagellar basal body-associated FliL family protein [Undibacterium cyanobacteriorum]|uniref:Flagellar protein FliL n=1 Tax=Undibacterium cyanobacteriorum TaxID=3073561 RepID=A0ABY9RIR3_9BURK|nr:flagellar basal body-associated FliL family protein [Undibacterium sp. 20NA77.5]WMW81112.1 flagellar basal body-associated FliL family protein [Undibacterium sp. 20NA77.5]